MNAARGAGMGVTMLYFINDYSEGAHPQVLARLAETNLEKLDGYGDDRYSLRAKDKLRAAMGCPEAEIFLLVGGTQTNQIVLDALLKSYEGVIAAASGHVNVHEAGAIEHGGHKVLALPHTDGKLSAATVRDYLATYYADGNYDHMVFPGAVYISHPTEYGTLYTKSELAALHEVCADYHIPLYLDGARLGYGLVSEGTDVTLADVAALTDVFYVGGTKCGALCGEAVVFPHGGMPAHFLTIVKQHGALLAKGRLLGVQFDALFTDDLYLSLSRNAVETAARIRAALREKGYRLRYENPTNQTFVILENEQVKSLAAHVVLGFTEKYDDTHTVMRICTSWATAPEDVDALIALL